MINNRACTPGKNMVLVTVTSSVSSLRIGYARTTGEWGARVQRVICNIEDPGEVTLRFGEISSG